MKKYPLKLEAYKKGVVWGGTTLKEKYGKVFEGDNLGETWELSVREKENSVIANGEYSGMSLKDYLEYPKEFPLLVKLLDAKEALSVQVHPHKHEMWYVVEAEEGAQIVYGVGKVFNREMIAREVRCGTLEKMLRCVKVKAGDSFFIPDGLVHSIGKGIVIAEIQENDDTTYRLYDYNRRQADGKMRELHIEESIETICPWQDEDIEKRRYSLGKKSGSNLANCPYFTADKYDIKGEKHFKNENWCHILCLDGEGSVSGELIKKGDSYFIPEGLSQYSIFSEKGISVIVSSVPND